jgi:predicted nuclease with RNAse H fold
LPNFATKSNVHLPLDSPVAFGVDVGAERIHLVGLAIDGSMAFARVLPTNELASFDACLGRLPPDGVVAIDGPGGPSAAAYADDETVSPKFRRARGCEVELGRQRRIWVSFVTGPEPLSGWMAVAEDLHGRVIRSQRRALETYPHAVFSTLLGRRPPKKTTAAGVTDRVGLLNEAGLQEPTMPMWSHDGLDAAAAAVVALHAYRGTAIEIRSDLDGTSLWLPPTPTK